MISLVAGGMIGSGIFMLPASLATFGSISLFGWLIAAIGALVLAKTFSSLSKVIPESGGSFAYTKAAFGDFPAFVVAWGYWISMWSTNAAVALTFAGYLGVFFPTTSQSPIFAPVVALVVIWILTYVNSRSVRSGGNIQVTTTVLKIIPVIVVAIGGFFFFNVNHFTPFNLSGESTFTAVSGASLLCFYAFLGIEAATIPADNIKNPSINIPRGTLIGVLVVVFLYILSTVSIFGVLSPEETASSTAPLSDAATRIFGPWASYLVAIGACISTFGALNCYILLQGQLAQSMARDGMLAKPMAYLNDQNSPTVALVVSCIFITILLLLNVTKGLTNLYTFMVELTTITSLLFYLSAVLVYGYFAYHREQGFTRSLKNGLITLIGLGFCLLVFLGSGLEILVWSGVCLLAGVPIYYYYTEKNK